MTPNPVKLVAGGEEFEARGREQTDPGHVRELSAANHSGAPG
jgi:hypothetical protein